MFTSTKILLLFSLLFVTTTFFFVSLANAACSGIVDPYSGACLTTALVVQPCDEATAISKCGCKTCALPGCSGCITRQCERGTLDVSGACECPRGWSTEYGEFPCASLAGVTSDLAENTTAPAALNSHESAPAPLAEQLQLASASSSDLTSSASSLLVLTTVNSGSINEDNQRLSTKAAAFVGFDIPPSSLHFSPASTTGTVRLDALVPRSSQIYLTPATRAAMWAPPIIMTVLVLLVLNFLIFGV